MKTVRILTNEEMTPTTRKARVLLQALKEKGISFGIISERLGYHFTWASHVRRGQHQVSTNILDKLQSMVDNEDPSLVTAKISEDKVSPITSDLILSLFSNRTKYTITDITRRLASKRIANGNIQMTVYRLRKTGKLIYSHRRYSLPSTPKSENAIARLDASTIIDPVVIDPLVVKEMLREEINKFLRTEEMKKIIYDAFSGAVERQFEIDKKEKHDN